jgi:DNA-binding transcriptional LysR family regulator
MEISQLKTLIALIETGSITATAQRLNRVPSAITIRLQQLEDDLGTPLFMREKKSLVATPKAMLLYQYAKQIIELADEAEHKIKSDQPYGPLRVGALESMAASKLPLPLARLYETYPTIELELVTGIRDTLYQSLIDGALDVALIGDAPQNPILDRTLIFDEELIIIAPKGHSPILTPSHTENATVLVFKEGCSYRDRLLSWYQLFNMTPKRIAEVTSYHTILGGVAAGMGIAIIPKSMLDIFPNKDLLSIHPINTELGRIQIELIWRKELVSANILALEKCLKSERSSLI